MYIRFTKSKKSKNPTLQIIHGYREGKKVKQKVLASLGAIKNEKDKVRLSKLAENLIKKLQKENYPIEKRINISDLIHKKTEFDGFRIVVDRLMKLTNFSKILNKIQGKKSYSIEEIVKLIIIQRLHNPSSKLRTYERQKQHGYDGIELHQIYRTMDHLLSYKEEILKQAFDIVCAYSSQSVDCFFFDVTTLYFESISQDSIKDFGFSKDQKYNQVQIVLSLVVNAEGMPLGYEVFEGSLSETKTLIPVLTSLKEKFSIKNVTVVCDRGLASRNNITALQENGFNYIIATKLRSISKKIKLNDLSLYQPLPNQESTPENEKILYYQLPHPQYESADLIITYSPKRALKDKGDRQRLLDKLRDKINLKASAIKKVISNSGYKKYINVDKSSSISLNDTAIEYDKSWDGFHGLAVSNQNNITPMMALSKYKDLWHVEETFRIAKSTLKARPIFHWKEHRIRSHILLCFMTLFFERFLELLLEKQNFKLTPDKIRYALEGIHSIFIKDNGSDKTLKILSQLSGDAEAIFQTINVSLNRKLNADVVAKY
jgi:transposase